jgi:uncharacterized protein (DUF427 family)
MTPNPNRVRVTIAGRLVADTTRALTLKEALLPAVQYIPREDVDMALLHRTEHTTHCPYKGAASYFTVSIGDRTAKNALCEQPVPAIAGRLVFYPHRIDGVEERPA